MRSSRRGQTQWKCHHCDKFLSSKRSYREHLNVHENIRPFKCEECNYASASQMTLRRHRLRSHISRAKWGYPCPYCTEIYMEPASYQQHVSHRHFGLSCTFGCPYGKCNFQSKSSKFFCDHISKHVNASTECSTEEVMAYPNKYLVDDEIGAGWGKPPLEAEIKRYELSDLSLTTHRNQPSRNSLGRGVKRKAPPAEVVYVEESQGEVLLEDAEAGEILIYNDDELVYAYEYESPPDAYGVIEDTDNDIDHDHDSSKLLNVKSEFPPPPAAASIVTTVTENVDTTNRLPDGQVDIDLD